MINNFSLGDFFIIGTFTTAIGTRKYPLLLLKKMLDNKEINYRDIKIVFSYLIISMICTLIAGGIMMVNIFGLLNMFRHPEMYAPGSGVFEMVKSMVYFVLLVIWWLFGFKPIMKDLELIERR